MPISKPPVMIRSILLSAAVAPLIPVLLGGCKVQEPPPFDPRAVHAPYRSAAEGVAQYPKRPLPTTLESEFLPERDGRPATRPTTAPTTGPALTLDPTVRLPLQEIVQRAVANNLDVRVAGYGPAIESTRVVEAEARYDPIFFTNAQFERRDRDQAAQFLSDAQSDVFTVQSGFRQNLYSGGQAELRYQASRTRDRSDVGPFGQTFDPNPYYENDLVLQVTQPLLRDFGNTVNRARIRISRNNQRISLLDFRRQLEETLAEIEQTYWQLVQAELDVRIQETLLDNTYRTAEILRARSGQDVTRVQLSQANSRLEQRRAVLVRSRSRVRDLSDRLKRLMNDPELPVTSPTLLLPATPAVMEPLNFDLEDQIATALENRLELGQQQLRVESSDIAREVARNNLLPQLNVVGSVSVQGLDDSFGDALDDQADFGNFGWAVGLQFEIPIGNRAARATYRRALLQQNQAMDQYNNLVNTIAEEVRAAAREVETSWNEMIQTRQARFAAADALLAVQQREDAGEVLSPTFVQLKLDQQSELAQAASAEAQAISNYNIALARLEQAKGTLLRYNNVLMEENRRQTAAAR